MNVLSLFDGMSCGQQALERANITVDNYYASEIDKYAIQVTMHNYPNTKQLGSVTDLDGYSLTKIDLLMGGSPCQSFSFAGKRKGMSTKCETEILTLEDYLKLKSDGYEFEGQSYLFWEYMRILKEVKPKYFLLENVMMGEKWELILSKAIGVNPVEINSALVSAQNRRRLYWTNIGLTPQGLFGDLLPTIKQPKDKGILLKDVLESEVAEKYFLKKDSFIFDRIKNKHPFTPRIPNEEQKSNCLKIGGQGVDDLILKIDKKGNIKNNQDKAGCFTTGGHSGGNHSDMDLIVAMRGRNPENPSDRTSGIPTEQRLEPRNDGKTNCLTSVQKDNLIAYGCDYRKDEGFRVRETEKSSTLMARAREDVYGTGLVKTQSNIRRLTPIECERLQTVKDNYTNVVSDSQRYKMLGNGWTIDVISHILNYMPKENFKK